MKMDQRRGWALAALLLAVSSTGALAAAESRIDKERGTVALLPDADLSNGRLVIKLVAFNRSKEPATLSAGDVKIYAAGNRPVSLVSLDVLIKETQDASRPQVSEQTMVLPHQPENYSHNDNAAMRSSTGQIVDGNYGGANAASSVGQLSTLPTGLSALSKEEQAKLDDKLSALRAGVLQSVTIAPGSAAGGQIVTEKLKIGRKDERTLHLTISFNGEQYDFVLPVPRDH